MTGRMRAVAAALLACCAACASTRAARSPAIRRTMTVGDSTVYLDYQPVDAAAASDVAAALPAALRRVGRWGRLREPVTITLCPSHEALEAAARRPGYPWLRAWARYATIDLQSPRTWQLLGGPSRRRLQETLTHELTHCLMYQASGTSWSWPRKGIPLWFREGMATVTAGEAPRYASPERAAAFYQGSPTARRPDGDPLSDAEKLVQSQDELVYTTAYLAFQFLLDRYGEERIRRLLADMGEGAAFSAAFRRAMGIDVEAFEADFRRYLAWRGFRGG
jgi:hypothetical protein